MEEYEIIRLIRQVIKQELAPILMGSVVSNESSSRSTIQRFATESPIGNLRSIQPYGVSSRAPAGTQGLIVPVRSDPTHLNLVGHFDEGKPTTNDGETILYDAYGHVIYLSQTKMQFGSKSSAQNMVLGQIFKTAFAKALLDQLQLETHTGNLGYPTSVPNNAAQYLEIENSPIDDNAILSDKAFTEK